MKISDILPKICLLLFFGLTSSFSTAEDRPSPTRPTKTDKAKLIVYTYDSFQSKWGPGPRLKEVFEKTCHCDVQFVTSPDAGVLLGRLKMERASTKADVVLGLDSAVSAEAKALGIFASDKSYAETKWDLPVSIEDLDVFQPIDFGWYTFMFDTESKLKLPAVKSMEELLASPEWDHRLIIQNAKSSSVGLGLLLWMEALYGDKAPQQLQKLSRKVMAVGQGWSDTYSKFTQGEAPAVFSYVTSEAYHRVVENKARYRALVFDEGHYVQVEVAGRIAASKQAELSKQFLVFLRSADAQKIIAMGNWMHPVVAMDGQLPQVFQELAKGKKSLYLPSSIVIKKRKRLTDEWNQILTLSLK